MHLPEALNNYSLFYINTFKSYPRNKKNIQNQVLIKSSGSSLITLIILFHIYMGKKLELADSVNHRVLGKAKF